MFSLRCEHTRVFLCARLFAACGAKYGFARGYVLGVCDACEHTPRLACYARFFCEHTHAISMSFAIKTVFFE